MSWIITAHGNEYPIDPTSLGAMPVAYTYPIEEIAHALAQINRYAGATTRPYSVAEHSLLVADLARKAGHSPIVELACLMHDAHEAYVGDVSSPLKWVLGEAWHTLESIHQNALLKTHGLTTASRVHRHLIKALDLVALATERRDLTLYTPGTSTQWTVIDTPGQEHKPDRWIHIDGAPDQYLTWTHWRDAFLSRHAKLQAELHEYQARQTQATGAPA